MLVVVGVAVGVATAVGGRGRGSVLRGRAPMETVVVVPVVLPPPPVDSPVQHFLVGMVSDVICAVRVLVVRL